MQACHMVQNINNSEDPAASIFSVEVWIYFRSFLLSYKNPETISKNPNILRPSYSGKNVKSHTLNILFQHSF